MIVVSVRAATRLQDLLRCSRQAINERVRNGRILALPTDKGEHLYPLWQFGPASQPLPGIAEIVETFAGAVPTPWTIASWLVGEEPELGGKAPIEVRGAATPGSRWRRRDTRRAAPPLGAARRSAFQSSSECQGTTGRWGEEPIGADRAEWHARTAAKQRKERLDERRCAAPQRPEAQLRVLDLRLRRRPRKAAGAVSDVPARDGLGPQAVAPVQRSSVGLSVSCRSAAPLRTPRR
jgi:hypothetical protein